MIADNDNCWCHKDMSHERFLELRDQGHDPECVHDDEEVSQDEVTVVIPQLPPHSVGTPWYDTQEHLGAGT